MAPICQTLPMLLTIIFIYFYSPNQSLFYPLEYSTKTTFFEMQQNMFLHNNPILKLNKKNQWSNCDLCNFQVKNTLSDSTFDDVIIGCAINFTENMIIFIRTLRTTGCKAACVFLVDQDAYLTIDEMTFKCIDECGGQVINCGNVPCYDLRDFQNYVYVMAYEFLMYNRHSIKRVIISDLFDTVFQGDPFNYQVDNMYLNVIDEGAVFASGIGKINREWVKRFNYVIPMWKKRRKYLCTGYIGADIDILLGFLVKLYQYMTLGLMKTDQGEMNFLFFSGILKDNGIHVAPERMNELVRHTAYKRLGPTEGIGNARGINNKNIYASIIHHYYANRLFMYSLYEACPRGNYSAKQYICKCNETCIFEFDQMLNRTK